ncbi:MAG: hypothetical protein H6767_00500 [Candidatus Peribacteria bacterium]|nr:MAG: hypothetical protein H6767_00500 [Candidatus Peribacteria bacterium]
MEATQQSIQVNRRLEPQDADGDGINDSGKLSIVIEADPQRAIQDAMWCMRNRYEECVDANTQATD